MAALDRNGDRLFRLPIVDSKASYLAGLVFVALAGFLAIAPAAEGQEPKIRVERDIVNGKADRVELRLNLALPGKGSGPFPAVVCIHGGFLLFHGAGDKLVPPQDSIDMADKLGAAGVSAKAVIVKGEGHGSADWVEKWAKSVEQAMAFFDAHLKK